MDHTRPIALAIPLGTWPARREHLLQRFDHLQEQDMHFTPGFEDDLIRRLQTLLFMSRRAVVDLLHT